MTDVHNRHAHILPEPEAEALRNSWLEAIHIEEQNQPRELVLDYHELKLTAPPALSWSEHLPWEHVQGYRVLRRMRLAV